MCQNIIQHKRKQFSVSVYQIPDQISQENFRLEAVNIESPKERAYLNFTNSVNLRGLKLKKYVESQVKLVENSRGVVEEIQLIIDVEQYTDKMAGMEQVIEDSVVPNKQE